MSVSCASAFLFFFFTATATTEIYTLSLHDALPIYKCATIGAPARRGLRSVAGPGAAATITEYHSRLCHLFGMFTKSCDRRDRKSTRLNSSHPSISYAVFCLKKKKQKYRHPHYPLTT